MNNSTLRIGVLGCKVNTLDFLKGISNRFEVNVVFSLPEETQSQPISGYAYEQLSEYCFVHDIPKVEVSSYSLVSDWQLFDRENLDVLFVIGWERLIPQSILTLLKVGCFGMHGSFRGLPFGKGRSPMNWAMITGKDSFTTHLFRYDSGVDSGDVFGTRNFAIDPYDTIKRLHQKNCDCMIDLATDLVQKLENNDRIAYVRQNQSFSTYYPKRLPIDGAIDWNAHAELVCRFINALSPPYPMAFSSFGGELDLIYFEKCVHFYESDSDLEAGEFVISDPENYEIKIGCSPGGVICKIYSGLTNLPIHGYLNSADYKSQTLDIIQRSDPNLTYENLNRFILR